MENVETKQHDSGLVTKLTSRFLGAVFGYLAIGLLITAGFVLDFRILLPRGIPLTAVFPIQVPKLRLSLALPR